MARGKITEEQLHNMLRELPEQDVPSGLAAQIMAAIITARPTYLQKVTALLTRPFTLQIHPLRTVAFFGTLLLVFCLGITIGEIRNKYARPPAEPITSATPLPSAEANYLVARELLAAGYWEEAVPFIHQANLLEPGNPEYGLWKGVALGKKGDAELEREIYRETVRQHPDYLPAHLYLAHNLLENGQPEAALEEYNRVLALSPSLGEALYNRALSYRIMGNKELQAGAWKEYLASNRTGKWAYRAVEHLNALGDFTYRSYQVGLRKIILNQHLLLSPDVEKQQEEIDFLARTFAKASGNILNLVVFLADEHLRAREQANMLLQTLADSLGHNPEKKIVISWFGEPETVQTPSGDELALKEGLLIFCTPQEDRTGEEMI